MAYGSSKRRALPISRFAQWPKPVSADRRAPESRDLLTASAPRAHAVEPNCARERLRAQLSARGRRGPPSRVRPLHCLARLTLGAGRDLVARDPRWPCAGRAGRSCVVERARSWESCPQTRMATGPLPCPNRSRAANPNAHRSRAPARADPEPVVPVRSALGPEHAVRFMVSG